MSNLELVALVVREYDPAIHFFVNVLGFELVEDVPSLTNDPRDEPYGRVAVFLDLEGNRWDLLG
jgi:catechol 2,3-dioxygenase-like lactoylglutathione lyase family enzyme